MRRTWDDRQTNVKILIVDDNKDNLEMAASTVQMLGHEAITAQSGYDALDIIAETGVRFVVVDWMMPEMDGIDLVHRIRAQFSERYTYIIMLTALGTIDHLEIGLEKADDFITKPFLPREMQARIRTGERILEMESRLTNSLEQMESMATRDYLTTLPNRRHFLSEAKTALEKQPQASLFMLDIDHFKQVNDRYGHPAGDEVLKVVARLCEEALKGVGLIGRYGGEEFIGLLLEHDAEKALAFVEALREKIEREVIQLKVDKLKVTVSIGITCRTGDETLEHLIEAADNALYDAKSNGRNQVQTAKTTEA